MKPFAMMPRRWILDGGLKQFRWKRSEGAINVAALMAYIALVQRAENGKVVITLDGLARAIYVSRQKIHDATELLHSHGLIIKQAGAGKSGSTYTITGMNDTWQKLPALSVTFEGRAILFKDFHLRKKAELNALKLYLLLVAFRDTADNSTKITDDKITEHSGIERNDIKSAIDILIYQNFIRLEFQATANAEMGKANVYRIKGVDSHIHRGTVSTGKKMDDFLDVKNTP